uniref:Magelike [Ciona intestinalis] n=1 Tax=Lepeophtheirus salmonis TaxID=72036 RepID=A0A0K2TSU6_LEPSM
MSSQSMDITDSQEGFSKKDLDKITSDVIFYVLSQEKKRLPLKKNDIFKACNIQNKSKALKENIMIEVKRQLSHIFGIDLREMNSRKGSSGMQYILINEKIEILKSLDDNYLNWSDTENAKLGLLFTVLGLIFMSPDGVVDDTVIYSFLKKLSVYDDSMSMDKTMAQKIRSTQGETEGVSPEIFSLFGNVRDLIHREWGSRQHYLDIKELPMKEGDSIPHFEFRWGERAEMEIKKSKILINVCLMYNCPPSYFNEQRQKILNGDNEEDCTILTDYESALSKDDELSTCESPS